LQIENCKLGTANSQFSIFNLQFAILFNRMTSSATVIKLGPFRLSPAAAGAACCLIAVLGYGAANACMRGLSNCELTWAICKKELVTVIVVGPWLVWRVWRRKMDFPSGRPLAVLLAAGLTTELIGNIGTQWGLGVVGLAVMIPANTGFVLVATAVLGRLLLGERVSARNAAVLAVLIAGLLVLGYGTSQAAAKRQNASQVSAELDAQKSPTQDPDPQVGAPRASPALVVAAIGVAAACGVVYALLAIALRYSAGAGTHLSAAVVIITATGVATLGPISFWHAGPAILMATSLKQYSLMYLAGVCNLVAFMSLVRGLQLTTALHINMLSNAGQVSLATLAGLVLFHEPCNAWLVLGVLAMIAGILAIEPPVSEEAIEAPL
jgi:drug/metabolite transporter, DME family